MFGCLFNLIYTRTARQGLDVFDGLRMILMSFGCLLIRWGFSAEAWDPSDAGGPRRHAGGSDGGCEGER